MKDEPRPAPLEAKSVARAPKKSSEQWPPQEAQDGSNLAGAISSLVRGLELG